jgi:hypothetical protein
MGYLLSVYLWAGLCAASPASPQPVPSPADAVSRQTDCLGWYTVTSAGVLGDRSGPYTLSGSVSQSPISADGFVAAGEYCITGGFWSSEFSARSGPEREEVTATSLKPAVFRLHRNSPNPFRQGTRIAYDLPARSKVRLSIYDAGGRQVKELAGGWQEAGRYNLDWDGRDKSGRRCPSGIYFCSLRTEDRTAVRKMLIAE